VGEHNRKKEMKEEGTAMHKYEDCELKYEGK